MGLPLQFGRGALWTVAVTLISRGVSDFPQSPYLGSGEIVAGGVLISVAEYLYEKGYIPEAVKALFKK